MRLSAIILAGGRSRRMGRPKEWLPLGGTTALGWQCRTLLACANPVVVVARGPGQDLPPLPTGVQRTDDREPGQGPLAGLVAGLERLGELGCDDSDLAFATACDMPFIDATTVRWLAGRLGAASLAIPRAGDRLQPLAAVYRIGARGGARRLLQAGERSLQALARLPGACVIDEAELRRFDPGLRCLRNLNTPDDHRRAAEELDGPPR